MKQSGQTCFGADFDVLLYDLTSTYIEGEMEQIPKAKHGYSRDHRSDCLQVVIALVVTPEGFPLAYEVLAATPRIAPRYAAFWKRSKPPTAGRGGCG